MHLFIIPLLPLAGAAINGLLGKRFPKALVNTIALGSTALAFAYALWVAAQFFALPPDQIPHVEHYLTWLSSGAFTAEYGMYLDQLSLFMLLIVSGVGFVIHIFSVGYMAHEGGYYRYFAYLNLFMFFMLTLVLANNYLLMFVGWEGVGLASYLLIGFWFRKPSAANAGKKAFITNRVGDFGFLIALFLLIKHFGTLQFHQLWPMVTRYPVESAGAGLLTAIGLLMLVGATGKSAQIPLYVWLPDAMEGPTPVSALIHAATMVTAGVYMVARSNPIFDRAPELSMGAVTIATLLLFLGATGKSAQIPLYVWLPDAMEGPTPVSALIHAATMVTAGVYMIGRNAVLFGHAPITLSIVAGIGIATALMAGTIGLVQNDIKRVLAYSTVSQLGYMFLAMGVGAWSAGIFHLYTHAFFKALLFLGSGAVIHALSGEQDLRNMGGLKKALPITYWTFLIGALAIAGIPPLAGFFSKDEILLRTFAHGNLIMWVVGMLTALLTATYMFRLVFLAFHGERRHDAPAAPAHPEEEEPAAKGIPHAAVGHAAPAAHSAADHGPHATGHGHGAHLHDAPPAMALALIVLAIGSVLAGFVGVPQAIGGSNRLEHFLAPSFEAHAIAPTSPEFQVAEGRATTRVELPAEASTEHAVSEQTELGLMALSVGVAVFGILIATYFWLRNRSAATKAARSAAPIYTLLLHKYYVDELYDAVFVQPIKRLSSVLLWRGVDAGLIDGSVNGVGALVRGTSTRLRRLQTGSIRVYAASLFLGVVLILGWYLMR